MVAMSTYVWILVSLERKKERKKERDIEPENITNVPLVAVT
jgi:hypothetical protein